MSLFDSKIDLMGHRREATQMAIERCLEIIKQIKNDAPLYDEITCDEITRRIKEEFEP